MKNKTNTRNEKRGTVRIVIAYGSLIPGQDYVVVDEGYDYVKVKGNGGVVFVPSTFIDLGYEPKPYFNDLDIVCGIEEDDYA